MWNEEKLYKVLNADGCSCHRGTLQWSLPLDGEPGEWHEVEGTLALCWRGLHLTREPARWWVTGARVFEAEAERVETYDQQEHKCVAGRVRLTRELVGADLLAVRVAAFGEHEIRDGYWIASDSATVRAWGSATVEAYDSATVEAWGSATVEAYDSATVEASDSATVRAYDSATVEAWGSATVRACGSATVRAWGSATVRACDSATVRASDSATVRAWGSATVRAWGSATVEACDSATVRASDSATVEACDSATVRAFRTSTVISHCGSATVALHDRAVWVDQRGERPVVTVANGDSNAQ